MAKRFTDTDKWKKKFIRSLQAPYKLLWLYILDECDHSGIWIVDFEVAHLRLNEIIEEQIALDVFSERIITIDNGDKWLILDFIEFQYGELNEKNRVHESVINSLKRYNIWDFEEKCIKKNKPLTSPFEGAKDKDKEKDKDKDKTEMRNIKDSGIDPVIGYSIEIYQAFIRNVNNKDLETISSIQWIKPLRELFDRKEYTIEQVKAVIEFALTEKFWKRIVINSEVLAKNFESLKISYQESINHERN